MKAYIPKGNAAPGNMQNLLRQAQKMQEDVAVKQEELASREYSATSGGGMVSAVVDGKHLITSLQIDPEAVDPEDTEMLCDLITAAVNEAIRSAVADADREMQQVTGGMTMPGVL